MERRVTDLTLEELFSYGPQDDPGKVRLERFHLSFLHLLGMKNMDC